LWARSQGHKAPLIHLAPHVERRILGRFGYRFWLFPRWLDPTIAFIKECNERGLIGVGPWAPSVLPVQILRLGHLAVAGLPNEPTTVAGRRLRATLEPELADLGIDTIVINGYANGHCQYLTTYEEYQHQGYEGANTHFGHWTLAGFRLCMRDLARELRYGGPDSRRTAAPSPDWDDALLEQLRDTPTMRRARAARWRA
jgi:hypothetical protein